MEKSKHRNRRDAAVSFNVHLDADDAIQKFLSRESGLFVVTKSKILRIRSPDDLDPNLEHPNAPWEQSVYLPHGATDPLVARTILQTEAMTEWTLVKGSEKQLAMMDISWELLNSLVYLRVMRARLDKRISEIVALIESDPAGYIEGESPKPLPIVEYYDIEFRAFVNEVRRALSKASELFIVLTDAEIKNGHFHKALEWAKKKHGEQSILAQMLEEDHKWIKLWIDVRDAIEHPKKTHFVETLNFSLEKNRDIRLPTWRFVHPDYDMSRPQNLLRSGSTNSDGAVGGLAA
jgi:hypothetical protein